MRRPRTILVALLVAVCCAGGGGAWLAVASADTPSPSPSASPSASVQPTPSASGSPVVFPTASPELVSWCAKWHKLAARDRRRVDRLRRCLGYRDARPLPGRPVSGASPESWERYGHTCKRLAHRWAAERPRDLRAILHPKVVSAASWKPLLHFVGWPASAIPDAITCMRRESGGRPRALNPSGCAGLFQEARCWWAGRFDPFSPLANVRCALAIWRREGWSPWVTM
jgi:hypothetical protein